MTNTRDYYNGNINVKKSGVLHNFTREQVEEYIKCKDDIIYFVKKYCKVITLDHGLQLLDLYPYQEHMINSYNDKRFVINLLPRQMGKSTAVAAYLMHYVLFNSDKTVGILANKAPTAREILGRIKRMYENLPLWMQPGVKTWNKGNIELGNNSTIIAASTSSDSIRGFSMNCVKGDTKITICDDNGRIFVIDIEQANSSKYKYNHNVFDEEPNMFYTVYKTTNLVNGKFYIGYHQTINLNDGYLGSGKVIKKVIEKYGKENFKKEIIAIFNNREDAEAHEALLVNKDFTLSKDNYNIALGGNVRIMYGENNPFYGKKHTAETKKYISTLHKNKNARLSDDLILDGIRYNSFSDAKTKLNCTAGELIKLILRTGNGFVCEQRQSALLDYVKMQEERKMQNVYAKSVACRDRFLGVPKSKEHKLKISKGLAGKPKTEEHVNKINRNPEKIRKTAEKHRGMKRSEQARENMSMAAKGRPAKNKGMKIFYNPENRTQKIQCFPESKPPGWVTFKELPDA